MLFNARKESFFLNLESGNDQSATVVLIPPVGQSADRSEEEQPSAPSEMSLTIAVDNGTKAALPQALQTASTSAVPTTALSTTAVPTTAVLTTAEAIAAQLAAEQEARPETPMATFAPDYLVPGNGLAQRRRRPGASMKNFRTLAGDLFKS